MKRHRRFLAPGSFESRSAARYRAARVAAVVACVAISPAFALKITLPNETTTLKPGSGSDLANKQCLVCHSADYVAMQPPGRPLAFWKAEVEKMKKVYGAAIPDDEIDPIAQYLTREYGAAAP